MSLLLQRDNQFDLLPSTLVSPLSLSNHDHVLSASCANLAFVSLFFSRKWLFVVFQLLHVMIVVTNSVFTCVRIQKTSDYWGEI